MGLLFGGAAVFMQLVFWGFIGLVWYIDSFWMAIGVAVPFVLLYKLTGRFMDFENQALESDGYNPELNAFQQPLSYDPSAKPQRRKLPG